MGVLGATVFELYETGVQLKTFPSESIKKKRLQLGHYDKHVKRTLPLLGIPDFDIAIVSTL